MAKCDEGYLCEVCGEEVEGLIESALYLQYVIGWVDAETLHNRRECHLRCLPNLAQFIEDPSFGSPVVVDGPFDRRLLDPDFAEKRAQLVTRGFRRLRELENDREGIHVLEYPLPEFRQP